MQRTVKEGIPEGMKMTLNGAGKKLNMFEFFKGTGSVGKVARKLGYNVVSLDLESKYTPDIEANILNWDYKQWAEENKFIPDYVWASPPCNTFSTLAYRLKERDTKTAEPKSERAKEGTAILRKTIEIIKYFQKKNPKLLYTIENPRGMMRHDAEIKKLPNRETTLYALYGDFKRKPTDFWSNFPMKLKPHTDKYDKKKVIGNLANLPTLEERYSIPSRLVKAILLRAKESYGSEPAMKGAGFFGDLWDSAKRAVSSTVDVVKTRVSDTVSSIRNVLAGKAPRERLSPSIRRLLGEIGDMPIVALRVRREPIQSALNSALNIISFGAWNSVRQKYQYDKFFHLQLECTVQVSNQDNLTRKYILEKNAVIELTVASNPNNDTETIVVPLDVGVTLNSLLEGAKRWLGTDFYKYDPFFSNCQDFVSALLRGSGLGNEEVFKFVKQPIDELIKEVPSWTGKIARALTDAGGIVDTVMYGQGKSKPMPKFAKQLEALGIKPVDYLAMAQKNAHKAGLAYNLLSFSTDDKHKLQIPNADGKIIRFGASGLKDYLLYSMTRDAKADRHRSNYRKRAMKIKGNWAEDPYSPNSLALSVLWS
jgi:hypothetical protein